MSQGHQRMAPPSGRPNTSLRPQGQAANPTVPPIAQTRPVQSQPTERRSVRHCILYLCTPSVLNYYNNLYQYQLNLRHVPAFIAL